MSSSGRRSADMMMMIIDATVGAVAERLAAVAGAILARSKYFYGLQIVVLCL